MNSIENPYSILRQSNDGDVEEEVLKLSNLGGGFKNNRAMILKQLHLR